MDTVRTSLQFEVAMAEVPVVAILRLQHAAEAVRVAAAVHAGGVRLLEVTLTTEGALDAVGAIRAAGLDGLSVGVGSVRTPAEAQRSLDAGAEYLITPTTNTDVVRLAGAVGTPIVCGGLTPTELDAAHRAGADYVKLFPASAVGPRYVREVLAPMPDLRIVPTGGVSASNIPEFKAAGAVGVGIGSALVDDAVVAAADWAELQRRAESLVAAWHG